MTLFDYTTPAEVRALLGVEVDELADETVELDLYYQGLLADLEDLSTNLPTDFMTVATIDEGERTAAEGRFYRAARVFAACAVAKEST